MVSKNHKLFYGSSYDRGLEILLNLWPDIKKKFPDATLDICYGWTLFNLGFADNPERLAWRDKMIKLMKQKGVKEHGRVGKDKLAEIRQSCGIWAYPTFFPEINCITALDCQKDGVVPVTIDYAALQETVGSGVKVTGDIYDKKTQNAWLLALYEYMEHEDVWSWANEEARKFAKGYEWDVIAKEWSKNF
jgi:glycosyltransferase involved in cell wall biosynthesis